MEAQAQLFNDAVAVVGPHGAGLANTIFCQEGTPVIEFTVLGLRNSPLYSALSRILELPYWTVPTPSLHWIRPSDVVDTLRTALAGSQGLVALQAAALGPLERDQTLESGTPGGDAGEKGKQEVGAAPPAPPAAGQFRTLMFPTRLLLYDSFVPSASSASSSAVTSHARSQVN